MTNPTGGTPAQHRLFFHTLLTNLPDTYCLIFDHELRFVEVQGGGVWRGGLSREALVGHTLREALPPATADILEPNFRAALAGEQRSFDMEFNQAILEMRTLPVRDAAGSITAGMVIAHDVTERREMSDQARQLETIIARAPDSIMVHDLAGKISYANVAAATMHRLASPNELVGRQAGWALAPEGADELRAEATAALEREGLWRGQAWYQLPDGTRLLVEVVWFVVTDDQGEPAGTAAIARDITQAARESEERAQLQQDIIEGQNAALRELSTPLIPLAEGVVVMPIIGTIDSRRAQQIMETLLEGIAVNQADIALLDISGVRVVDTQVADALLRAAKAAKLLGTRIVLTGIKAEVAQTVVHLGADMTEIITRSNLQEGLRYALEASGSDFFSQRR